MELSSDSRDCGHVIEHAHDVHVRDGSVRLDRRRDGDGLTSPQVVEGTCSGGVAGVGLDGDVVDGLGFEPGEQEACIKLRTVQI